MPNHITNRLTIIGNDSQIKQLLEFIKIEESDAYVDVYDKKIFGIGTIDFNKITPMPKWVFRGDLSDADEKKYGAENCWYEWSRSNWGTKWNAYSQNDKRNTHNTIYFQTAWSGVPDLMRKLSLIFPDITLEYGWADEDFGANVRLIKIKNGEISNVEKPQNFSKDAYDLALNITRTNLNDHSLKYDEQKANYVYTET